MGRRAMTNMLLCLLKPNISPSLSLLSRLQVDAHTRSGRVESQGAPFDGEGSDKTLPDPPKEALG